MGGEGSGRKPSAETIVKRFSPEITPVGNSIFIPDYSGIKDEARKTSSVDITSSGGGVNDWISGSVFIQPKPKYLQISGSGLISSGTVSGSSYIDANINHDNLSGFVANEHIDWTSASAGTIHASNYVDNNTQLSQEQVEDFAGAMIANATGTHTGIAITYQDATGDMDFVVDHDTATNYVANEHIDWTASSAGTIHATNYVDNDTTDHTLLSNIGSNSHATIDTHLANTSNPHSVTLAQVGGTTDHTALSNIGTNTHSQIDTHIALVNEHINWTNATQNLVTSGNLSGTNITANNISGALLYGDGSNITGISVPGDNLGNHIATQTISGSSVSMTGNISGSLIYGDGSNLTNLPSSGDNLGNHQATQMLSGSDITMSGSAIFGKTIGFENNFIVNVSGSRAIDVSGSTLSMGMFTTPNAISGSVSIGNNPTQLNRYVLGVGKAFTETSDLQAGSVYSVNANPTASSSAMTYGLYIEAGTSTGNAQNLTAVAGLTGTRTGIRHRGTGVVSNAYSHVVDTVAVPNAGSITTAYGLYIGLQKHATKVTTGYGIYQDATADINYLLGNTGFGVIAPSERLAVEGRIQLDEVANPTGTTGYGKVFVHTDTRLKYMDGSGNKVTIPQVIDTNVTAVGNVGEGEDDLMTHTIDVTNHMGVNGDSLTIYASGKDNASMSSSIKAMFGSTTIFSSAETLTSEWFAEIKILRIGQSDQVAYWEYNDTGGNISITKGVTAMTENLSTDKTFKFTGEGGDGMGDNEVTQEYMTIIHNPSQI
jgi:hypothetical protein